MITSAHPEVEDYEHWDDVMDNLSYVRELLDELSAFNNAGRVKPEATDTGMYLKTVLSSVKPTLDYLDIRLVTDIPNDLPTLMLDRIQIRQMLLNLLKNAWEAVPVPGGQISVTAFTEKSGICINIQDNGCGIAKDKQEIIFKRFEQADNSDLARRQGTGLGLAISNRLVHMMDSEIELQSELGKGSIFGFHVTLELAQDQEEVKKAEDHPLNVEGKRILIAEDNELNMEIITTILKDYKVIVESAYNGQEALDKIKASAPGYYDLIFMDIMMPVMDGLEATKEIRRLSRRDCQEIPIIAMSANAFDEDVKKSLASGMNGHLSKPIDLAKFEEVLLLISS